MRATKAVWGLAICLIWLMTLACTTAWALDWSVQRVDEVGNVGPYSSIALDATGRPCISYVDWSNRDLKFAAWNGSSWSVETVDDDWVYSGTSLVFDSGGTPHINYAFDTGEWSGGLRYAFKQGASWITETVYTERFGQAPHCIVMGDDDIPSVIYSPEDLYCATRTAGAWETQRIVDSDAWRQALDAAEDSTGKIHIISWQGGSTIYHRVYYTTWDGTQVHEEDLGPHTFAWYVSITLDKQGSPHLAYRDTYTTDKLVYAYQASGSWSFETVPNAYVFSGCDIVLDESGNPLIAYCSNSKDLQVAMRSSSGLWTIDTVDSIGDVWFDASMTSDGHGTYHISYYDSTNGDLKYAVGIPEPATLGLLAVGLGAIWLKRRRKA